MVQQLSSLHYTNLFFLSDVLFFSFELTFFLLFVVSSFFDSPSFAFISSCPFDSPFSFCSSFFFRDFLSPSRCGDFFFFSFLPLFASLDDESLSDELSSELVPALDEFSSDDDDDDDESEELEDFSFDFCFSCSFGFSSSSNDFSSSCVRRLERPLTDGDWR